jgi:hypothetical protein
MKAGVAKAAAPASTARREGWVDFTKLMTALLRLFPDCLLGFRFDAL